MLQALLVLRISYLTLGLELKPRLADLDLRFGTLDLGLAGLVLCVWRLICVVEVAPCQLVPSCEIHVARTLLDRI